MSSQFNFTNDEERIILDAALRLSAGEDGMSFSMDRLAQASGVSRATLYRRYGSRATILARLAQVHEVSPDLLESERDIHECILQAARRVVSSNGTLNITMEQVAQEAGVGVATVYRHFTNKDTLMREFAGRIHPRRAVNDMLQQISDDVEADLIQFAVSSLQFMLAFHDLLPVLFSEEPKSRQFFNGLRADHERTLNVLSRFLEAHMQAGHLPGGNAFDLATAFVGMLVGFAFIQPNYGHTVTDPQQTAVFIARFFLNGIEEEKE